MRKLLLGLVLASFLVTAAAYAAVEVKNAGTVVNKTETINITGPSISANGTDVDISTLTETGNKTVIGSLTTDGTLYTAKIISDGAVYPGYASLNPCGTLGRGYIYVASSGMPCFCTAAGVDKSIYDGSSACAY